MGKQDLATPEYIRKRVLEVGKTHEIAGTSLHYKTRGGMLANLQNACQMYVENHLEIEDKKQVKEKARETRLLVISYLCLPDDALFEMIETSSEISDGHWLGLTYWQFGHSKNSEMVSKRRENFLSELHWVIYRAQYDLARSRAQGGIPMSRLYIAWDVPEDMKQFVDEIKINAPNVIESNLRKTIAPEPIPVVEPEKPEPQSNIREEIIEW